MTKIHHYVNLVGWYEIYNSIVGNDISSVKNIVYCDSLSLSILSRFFGNSVLRLPGPIAFSNYISSNGLSKCTILSSDGFGATYKLPFFKNLSEIDSFLPEYPILNQDILIGISSPKQNVLASKLAKLVSVDYEIDIHCLGAALNLKDFVKGSTYFFWANFLRADFKRTSKKLLLTLYEILLLLSPSRRKKFRSFLFILETKP